MHCTLLTEAFARHNLCFLPELYHHGVAPFLTPNVHRMRREVINQLNKRLFAYYPWNGSSLPMIALYQRRFSVPIVMEGRAKGWPTGRAHLYLWYSPSNTYICYQIKRLGLMFGDHTPPWRARLYSHFLADVHVTLLNACNWGHANNPTPILERLVRTRKCSRLLLEKAKLHQWPARFALRRSKWEEPEYKVLAEIRQYRRIGDLRPSFVLLWERGRKQRRRLKKQLLAREK